MQSPTPAFTVIVATYGRGALIEPTLASISAQQSVDFEVLVVSDGPAADGLADSVSYFGSRFRLIELPVRYGSQFAPNNTGLKEARGDVVAYLGHDDVWHPQHLERINTAFTNYPDAMFAVAGCLVLGPEGSHEQWVTGLFDANDRAAPEREFFPPSSFAHRRDLPPEAAHWPDPKEARIPIDMAFELQAHRAGCRFVSTRSVTVLKFTAIGRYLSYLVPSCDEQNLWLERFGNVTEADQVLTNLVAEARASDRVMTTRQHPATGAPGDVWKHMLRVRGATDITCAPLTERMEVPLGDDSRGLDWYPPEHGTLGGATTWRWSGPNPRPRLAIPFTADESTSAIARITLTVAAFASDDVRESLRIVMNGSPVDFTLTLQPTGGAVISWCAPLLTERASVVELLTGRSVPQDEARVRATSLAGRAWGALPTPWRRHVEGVILKGSPRVRALARRSQRRVQLPLVARPRRLGIALAGIEVSPVTAPQ